MKEHIYSVSVGGGVIVFKRKTVLVQALNEEEAREKAFKSFRASQKASNEQRLNMLDEVYAGKVECTDKQLLKERNYYKYEKE